jgi:hypothetical protein
MSKHLFCILITVSFFIFSTDLSFARGADSTLPGKSNTITAVIPADYKPEQHILLVAEMPRRTNTNKRNKFVTKKLDKALKENYPYKYQIVTRKDIMDNSKYADTSIYKYALLNHLKFSTHTRPETISATGMRSGGTTVTTTYIDFHFYDRTNSSEYQLTGKSSPYVGHVIKAFAALVKKENEKTAP